jgi:antitoxin HigA-1
LTAPLKRKRGGQVTTPPFTRRAPLKKTRYQAMARHKMRPVSPGEVLREQLEELGMSANALASALHVPTNRITGILNATRALTPETALRLERYFAGTTAQFWLNLQTSFDLRRAEIEGVKELREIRPLKAG